MAEELLGSAVGAVANVFIDRHDSQQAIGCQSHVGGLAGREGGRAKMDGAQSIREKPRQVKLEERIVRGVAKMQTSEFARGVATNQPAGRPS